MMDYNDSVKEIAANVINQVTNTNMMSETFAGSQVSGFEDSELLDEVFRGETHQWLVSKNMIDITSMELNFKACQFVAGNSDSIEESFDNMYRKDGFADVCINALMQDVVIRVKNIMSEFVSDEEAFPNFCNRDR